MSSPTRTKRMGSRGVPRPHSISGQTGTHSTKRPKVSVRNVSRLWPPSKRTASPSRHDEMPTRIGIDASAVFVEVSDRAAVIRPVQQRLPLFPAALEVARLAVPANGRRMARDRPPPPDLPRIVSRPSPHVVPAIPLEPAARILRADPAVAPPDGQGLGGVDTEVIEAGVAARRRELRANEPAGRKLATAVGQVLPAENA